MNKFSLRNSLSSRIAIALAFICLSVSFGAGKTEIGKGEISVKAIVTGACIFKGSELESGQDYSFGTLDFAQVGFEAIDTGYADTQLSVGYDCRTENGLAIYIESSDNSGDGLNRLLKNANDNEIKYAIFNNPQFSAELYDGDKLYQSNPLVAKGEIPIYARAYLTEKIYPAGIYTDKIRVRIEF